MKLHLLFVACLLATLLCTHTAGLIIRQSFLSTQPRDTEVDQQLFAKPPLLALRKTPSGGFASLEAFRVIGSRREQIWATSGRPSLARDPVSGRIFEPNLASVGGFSARLLLNNPGDDEALAKAASASEGSTVSSCQIVRLPPTRLNCTAAVRLPEGFTVEVTGSTASLLVRPGRFPATALVAFNSLGGVWQPEALQDLEQHGEVVCRVSVLRPVAGDTLTAVLLASDFHLRSADAVDLTPELEAVASVPTQRCQRSSFPRMDLLAAYNFRSSRRITNLAPGSGGRFQVLGRGRVSFTPEGVELPGRSWVEVDTEDGALTEHMRFGSRWSVFFMFRTAAESSHRQANLFSVHASDNPRACSVLAWTTTSEPRGAQDSIYTRQRNLPEGFASGQTTQPLLDSRSGAWNQVGISSDRRGRQTVFINGARAPTAALYRFPVPQSAGEERQASLRRALSIGLVRGPRQAMQGTFRCFGVARGTLSGEQFHNAFATYCQ